ncbi:hypothetical protein E1B28_000028 [Marasmius oreades]|uniref:GDP/GTP exchange factor Sec2 N-terminal domain-containing protein n=1 Tax=Marasmius oreades TaxID=181124 RepID=A0A9P8ADX1_9AGAR|nr:uncharacterized protein E1B28_000028 [Marasmius oreades]KAG7098054.1 hypothetical protein E1B28_000028 [Marasmius oreades]
MFDTGTTAICDTLYSVILDLLTARDRKAIFGEHMYMGVTPVLFLSPQMLHFPSSSQYLPRRTDSLNATQQRASSKSINGNQDNNDKEALLLKIEEDLHDARRVEAHGQEDDLRMALGMVIKRVGELTSILTEALKTQADLEVQLNVAKSNLKLVISNNEMLEEALRSSSHNPKDVGWRRSAQTPTTTGSGSVSIPPSPLPHPASGPTSPTPSSPESPRVSMSSSTNPYFTSTTPAPTTPLSATAAPSSESRFFKFRFSSSSSNLSQQQHNNGGAATPTSPHPHPHGGVHPHSPYQPHPHSHPHPHPHPHPHSPYHPHHAHTASSSMSSLHSTTSSHHNHQVEDLEKDVSSLKTQLEKEKAAHQKALSDKSQLEEELESLSQALFEEANKMVKTERMKRAETEDELKEVREQKQALQSALKVVEREVVVLRGDSGSGVGGGGGLELPVPAALDLESTPRPRLPSSSSSSTTELELNSEERDGVLDNSSAFGVVKRLRSDSEMGVKSRPGSPVSREEEAECNDDGDTTVVLTVPQQDGSDTLLTSPTPSTSSESSSSSSYTVTPGLTPGPSSATFPPSSSSSPSLTTTPAAATTDTPSLSPVTLNAKPNANITAKSSPFGEDPEPSPWADARSIPYIFSSVSI